MANKFKIKVVKFHHTPILKDKWHKRFKSVGELKITLILIEQIQT